MRNKEIANFWGILLLILIFRQNFVTNGESKDKSASVFYLQKLAHLHNELNVLIESYVNILLAIPALGLAFLVFLLSVLNFYLLYLDLTHQLESGSILITNFMVWYMFIVNLSVVGIGFLTICRHEVCELLLRVN